MVHEVKHSSTRDGKSWKEGRIQRKRDRIRKRTYGAEGERKREMERLVLNRQTSTCIHRGTYVTARWKGEILFDAPLFSSFFLGKELRERRRRKKTEERGLIDCPEDGLDAEALIHT